MRFLLTSLLAPFEGVGFQDIDYYVPDIYLATRKQIENTPRPRLLKSHEYLDPRYERVIYLVRHPADVAISYYHYLKDRGEIRAGDGLDDFLKRFVTGDIDPYGTWREHVGGWLGARRGDRNFCLVRYEDLRQDTMSILHRVAAFLEIDSDLGAMSAAVRESRFERLKELDRYRQQPGQFFRSGRSGEGLEILGPRLLQWLEGGCSPAMEDAGCNRGTVRTPG